ncbi:hypothetical protein CR983_04395 [Candidatus Saccharibacteria bacterium]|nr:MAG: hypothetical protein CR983_04395 [Candidatus Saccharibacteria bacterium]
MPNIPDHLSSTIDQHPFADPTAQTVFAEWCDANAVSRPVFEARSTEDRRGQSSARSPLRVPASLALWELAAVVEQLEPPDERGSGRKRIEQLGRQMAQTGMYLSQYADGAPSLADTTAQQLYQYGRSLQEGIRCQDSLPTDTELSEEEKTEIDEWLLGKKLYDRQRALLGEQPSSETLDRRRAQLVRVCFEAMADSDRKNPPWSAVKGPRQLLADSIDEHLTRAIERPVEEVYGAVFDRGVAHLLTHMKEPDQQAAVGGLLDQLHIGSLLKRERLYDTLHIDQHKQELDTLRARSDSTTVAAKELTIARAIHRAVSSLPYDELHYRPSDITKTQRINCLGASILGGALLEETGINYLHAVMPGHSATVLTTSDGRAYFQDFTPGRLKTNYTELHPYVCDSSGVFTDIMSTPDDDTLLYFRGWNPYPRLNKIFGMQLRHPSASLRAHILDSISSDFSDQCRHFETIEASRRAINLEPSYAPSYNRLGYAFIRVGEPESAAVALRQAIKLNPHDASTYNNLGLALTMLDEYVDAAETFKRSVELNPNHAPALNGLGYTNAMLEKYNEALDAFQRARRLNPADAHACKGAAESLYRLNRNEAAVKAFGEAIKLDPDDAFCYRGLGNALSSLGEYRDAARCYRHAIRLDPDRATPYFELGVAYKHLGKHRQSIQAFRAFIELGADNPSKIARAKREINAAAG